MGIEGKKGISKTVRGAIAAVGLTMVSAETQAGDSNVELPARNPLAVERSNTVDTQAEAPKLFYQNSPEMERMRRQLLQQDIEGHQDVPKSYFRQFVFKLQQFYPELKGKIAFRRLIPRSDTTYDAAFQTPDGEIIVKLSDQVHWAAGDLTNRLLEEFRKAGVTVGSQ